MIELEKKWVLKEIPNLTKYGFELVKAEQFLQGYLSKEERVRRIRKPGSKIKTYEHFTKSKIAEGQSIETSREITELEYTKYHKKVYKELLKIRTTYLDVASGFIYEVDHLKFDKPRVDIILMEVEFQDRFDNMNEVNEYFQLPEFFDNYVLQDVTDNVNYSNYMLAQPLK